MSQNGEWQLKKDKISLALEFKIKLRLNVFCNRYINSLVVNTVK